jgi:hypothetical protein
MTWQRQNFGETTAAEAVDNSETTLTVTDGGVFPSSGNFAVLMDDEIMHVTARSTNDLTVARGAEGTSAVAHDNGAPIVQVMTYNSLPGQELDYAEYTSGDISVTSTTEASGTTVVDGNSVTYDGRTEVWIEFFASGAKPAPVQGLSMFINVVEDSTTIDRIAVVQNETQASHAITSGVRAPVLAKMKHTPSSGAHTYHITAYLSSAGTGVVKAGAGGATNFAPLYIRITVA